MERRQSWFLVGLFLTTLTTLCLEVLDTRLLSVMTWYHLSFFAVSTAMFGMSAGALRVYLGGERFEGERAVQALGSYGTLYAIAIPVTHVLALQVPILEGFSLQMAFGMTLLTLLLAVPFYLSGILVAIALTRIPGRIGLVYAVDLVGAALGCLLLVPLLEWTNASSVALILGGLAGLGALAFQLFAGDVRLVSRVLTVALGAAFVFAGVVNPNEGTRRVGIWYSKGRLVDLAKINHETWSLHAQLSVASVAQDASPFYWGAGLGHEQHRVDRLLLRLDGEAGTTMTRWDGTPEGLAWVQHDVTTLPYFLRRGGSAAVIGVGGGRDVLTALWGEHRQITGIEINKSFLHLLERDIEMKSADGEPRGITYRDFAGIGARPEVSLVHDEARSYLTRTTDRYDVLQMSLIDTWAATGAGAFTLTENGLYTLEGWRVFLDVLTPTGLFSVSRWYDPENASETSRLIALAVASLLDRGIEDPARHMALVSRLRVATLLVSLQPLSADDLDQLSRTCETYGHTILLAPGVSSSVPALDGIARSRSTGELARAVEHPIFDYSPPTDERPYFFNILKPSLALNVFARIDHQHSPGIIAGNLTATNTLMVLGAIALVLVLAVILVPLVRSGMPSMSGPSFLFSLLYFACIGLGFMLIQVPYMQRFSVYLGQPVYAVVVILFSMILCAGFGSLLSDRLPVERRPIWLFLYPLLIAGTLFLQLIFLQEIIESTIRLGLLTRCAVVVALVTPVSLLLGLCFPIGMRLVARISHDATPWMWGINGATGVLGAVIAVGISMWAGIHTSLEVALLLYAALTLLAPILWWMGRGAPLPQAQRDRSGTAEPPAELAAEPVAEPVLGVVGEGRPA